MVKRTVWGVCVCMCVCTRYRGGQLKPKGQLSIGQGDLGAQFLTRSCCSIWRIQCVGKNVNLLSQFFSNRKGQCRRTEFFIILYFALVILHSILTSLNIEGPQYKC